MELQDLLARSDFVVCLALATAETENLMNAAAFARMKRGAYFLNPSRGNLVDEAALRAALDSGQVASAALDVGRAPDQMPTPELAAHPRVVATPHVGGLTPAATLHQAMDTLGEAFGIGTLLLEGGGAINGAFLKAGLIDEISVLVYPGVDGLAGVPSIFEYGGGAEEKPAAGRSLRHLATETLDGGMVWLHYGIEGSPASA